MTHRKPEASVQGEYTIKKGGVKKITKKKSWHAELMAVGVDRVENLPLPTVLLNPAFNRASAMDSQGL